MSESNTTTEVDIAGLVAEPKQVTVDGETVIQQSVTDAIAADKYLASKAANSKPSRGLLFTKLVPGGAV